MPEEGQPLEADQWNSRRWVAAGMAIAVMLGVFPDISGFTFGYANGPSYFSTNSARQGDRLKALAVSVITEVGDLPCPNLRPITITVASIHEGDPAGGIRIYGIQPIHECLGCP